MATVLWDFDGTLATRPGLWSQAMLHVLDRHQPGHGLVRDDFRPALHNGFPWHSHDQGHPHLNEPDAWWGEIDRLIGAAFASVGLNPDDVRRCTRLFREVFLDPQAWEVYDDTDAVLRLLSSRGWRHVIVSNHVPELPHLVEQLGLAHHFDDVITSASVGYEKPHPEIFHRATERLADGPVVMVGDNPVADVAGARAVGIPGFLVRRRHDDHPHHPDLYALAETLRRFNDE